MNKLKTIFGLFLLIIISSIITGIVNLTIFWFILIIPSLFGVSGESEGYGIWLAYILFISWPIEALILSAYLSWKNRKKPEIEKSNIHS